MVYILEPHEKGVGFRILKEGAERASFTDSTTAGVLAKFEEKIGSKATKENRVTLLMLNEKGLVTKIRIYPRNIKPRT